MSKEIRDIIDQFGENIHEDGLDAAKWAVKRIEALIESKCKEQRFLCVTAYIDKCNRSSGRIKKQYTIIKAIEATPTPTN